MATLLRPLLKVLGSSLCVLTVFPGRPGHTDLELLAITLSFLFVLILIFEKDLKFFVLSTSVLLACYKFASYVCSTEGARTSGAGVIIIMSCYVGPGNGAQVLCKSSQRS